MFPSNWLNIDSPSFGLGAKQAKQFCVVSSFQVFALAAK